MLMWMGNEARHQKKETMMNHSPTPWKILEDGRKYQKNGKPVDRYAQVAATVPSGDYIVADFNRMSGDANAHHVVKCVNLHDELVYAIQRGIAALEANGAPNCEGAKEMRAVLSKAVARG